MRALTISTVVLSAFLLFGVSTTEFAHAEGKKFVVKHKDKQMGEVTADKALVYILRPAFVGKVIKMWAFADEQFIGVTYGKQYTYALVEPGEHVFWSKSENVSGLRMTVEAGKTYHLQQKIRPGGWKASVKLIEAEASEVPKFFKKCKYVTPTERAHTRARELFQESYDDARKRADYRDTKE